MESEQATHEDRERELLRIKEQLKFEQMELELVNTVKVAEVKQQHEKQLHKLRQQFEDGLNELRLRCEGRLSQLETDLELRRRVEVHEVEERKNQHINDLIKNHRKAFTQMKAYYNDITERNLTIIKDLQKNVEQLKEKSVNSKRALFNCIQEHQKLSEPLAKVSTEIAELQTLLKERSKDQMALRNANSRLASISKSSTAMKVKLTALEDEYAAVERERDHLYGNFEESIQRVRQQSDFHNQALEQRLIAAEANVEKAGMQVQEIIQAANLDSNEVTRMMSSLHQMLAAKDEALREAKFSVIKLQKAFNDSLETFVAKMKELGVPEEELRNTGFQMESLPIGSTAAPAVGLITQFH